MNRETYRLSGLVHEYERKTALTLALLVIGQGSIVGLAGPNGSGKSTLLRILALVEKPTRGQVLFRGREADYESARHRRSVSMLLQDPYLLKRSVFENVAYGLRVRGDTVDLEARVRQALEWVGLTPAGFMRRSDRALSGGEAQRVALAARLILKPEVLLLDEPTAGVDAASAMLIREAALRARQERGCTLVIASHDTAWLDAVADQTIHLYEGRVTETGLVNLITGPWRKSDRGLFVKELSDGTRIVSSGPGGPGSAAMVDPKDITLFLRPPEKKPGLNLLPGRLIRLSLSNGGSRIMAGTSVGGLVLIAYLNPGATKESPLLPGRKVWLAFNCDSLKWL